MDTSDSKRRRRSGNAPTIADVAELAGVSLMTVSRVLNGAEGVRPRNREAVQAAIATLRYSPNRAAQALAGARSIRIGLICTDLGAWFLSDLLFGSLDEAKRHHAEIVVDHLLPGGDLLALLASRIEAGIDAILLAPPLSESQLALRFLADHDIPTLALTAGRSDARTYSVFIDDYAAARAMTGHLLSLGHRRIGFITGTPGLAASELRLQGFRDGMRAAGLADDALLVIEGAFTFASGFDAAQTLLALEMPPTAIFASNDDMAAAVIAVAHKLGFDVPADLSVCGCDDTNLATAIWPTLTTIRQPLGDMARRAVAMLAQGVRNRNATPIEDRHEQFPFDLVRRQSDSVPRRLGRGTPVSDPG